MAIDDSLVGLLTFDHRYISLRRLRALATEAMVGEHDDLAVTVSGVTGDLRIHTPRADGRPGEMIGVINLASEDIDWYDDDDEGEPPSP